MAVKDEVDIALSMIGKPSIPLRTSEGIAKSFVGGSNTGPTISPQKSNAGLNTIEEITEEDVRQVAPKQKKGMSKDERLRLRKTVLESRSKAIPERQAIYEDEDLEDTDDEMEWDEVVDDMFDCMDSIDEVIEDYAKDAGRIGEKMMKAWSAHKKTAKEFEFFFERVIRKLRR